jgi:hypothetical protein
MIPKQRPSKGSGWVIMTIPGLEEKMISGNQF